MALGSVKERRFGGDVWVIAGRRPMSDEFRLQQQCERIFADPANQVEKRPTRPNPGPPTGPLLWLYRADTQPQVIDLPAPIR